MSTTLVYWEDLVFEYRNKDYGAYPLRYAYPFHLSVSAGIVLFIFLAVMVGPILFKEAPQQTADMEKKVRVINYTELAPPPPIEKTYVPPPPKDVVIQKIAVKKYIPPKVTTQEVKDPEEIITIREIKEDIRTSEDTSDDSEGVRTVVTAPSRAEPGPVVVQNVQKDPEFPGGKKRLMTWLQNHLKYPSMAVRMGIEGVVRVSFAVDTNGKIADVKVLQPLHMLCDKEAIRLVSSMPDWIPGEINGVKTTTTYTLPIRFKLD